jgi:hypothetical protein
VLPEYLRLVLWPAPLRLDWGLPEPLALADVWPGALLLVVLFALSLYALWRWPAAGFVGVAVFALLAPSSSFVPVASEVGADRRMYLPLALLIPLALGLGAHVRPRGGAWAVALVAAIFAALSAARAATFADPIALWHGAAEAVPGNARARYNLAGWLERAGRTDEAAAEKARALAGELAFYTRILPLQPDRPQALGDLAALELAAGDLARAEAFLAEAVALRPDDALARRRLELVRARLAAQSRAAPE